MGVALKDITIRHEIELAQLAGKTCSVDAFNILYQFLASIRQRDGTLLMDSKGRTTSHLMGIFTRCSRLMQQNIRLVFVFDGKAPALKAEEQKRRSKLKEKAYEDFKKAKEEGDMEGMLKFSSRTSRITPEILESAKQLLSAMGIPIIVAPSEGEAQAAHLVKKGDVYACISQDYDNLLFGVPRLLQNVTLSEKRRLPNKVAFETVKPMFVELEENLRHWNITHKQLIALALLVGTDFNPDGIARVGPKTALNLVRQFGDDLDGLFREVKWDEFYPFPYTEVYKVISEMPVTDDYQLEFRGINEEAVVNLLCREYEFSEERIRSGLAAIQQAQKTNRQKSLFDF